MYVPTDFAMGFFTDFAVGFAMGFAMGFFYGFRTGFFFTVFAMAFFLRFLQWGFFLRFRNGVLAIDLHTFIWESKIGPVFNPPPRFCEYLNNQCSNQESDKSSEV